MENTFPYVSISRRYTHSCMWPISRFLSQQWGGEARQFLLKVPYLWLFIACKWSPSLRTHVIRLDVTWIIKYALSVATFIILTTFALDSDAWQESKSYFFLHIGNTNKWNQKLNSMEWQEGRKWSRSYDYSFELLDVR